MEETTPSRASDAAATKKRRSSILKSQRAVRTPFSELEFNVATPTDTCKRRRVSFARRTGVAEFATNEATTTWKNFYEEHNKSLESSGNDSGANSSNQIGHFGKHFFDQQFEEVEADLIGSLNPGFNCNSSITNVNFGHISIQESTTDIKVSNSHRQFELSHLTNTQNKVFGDELMIPEMEKNSQPIDINFSAITPIDVNDDLDEIQKDLKNNQNNLCHGPFNRQNVSEYIEVNLNSTHGIKNEESDMSITDTIHSPKVQELSKSVSIEKVPSNNWETDKENVAINPYVTPKESTNFAINEEPDRVLIFDGKRLILQPDIVPEPTIPQNIEPQRKSIVLNVHDDLPNFIDDPHSGALGYISVADLKHNTQYDCDMSITRTLSKHDQSQSQKTVIFDDLADITFTQAVPTNIVQGNRRTLVYHNESGDISITQAVPVNIIDKTDKTRTVLYENETGNLNITQVVTSNVLPEEKRETTQAVSTNVIDKISETRTMLYKNETEILNITQMDPTDIIPEDRRETIDGLSTNITENTSKTHTILYENDRGNLNITQVVPTDIIPQERKETIQPVSSVLFEKTSKTRTVLYDDETGNLNITQVAPTDVFKENRETTQSVFTNVIEKTSEIHTILYENEAGNLSNTQVVHSNVILPQEENKTIYDKEDASVCITDKIAPTIVIADHSGNLSIKAAPNIIINDKTSPEINRTLVYKNKAGKVSVTQSISSKVAESDAKIERRQTVIFENDIGNISVTQVIPGKILLPFNNIEISNISVTQSLTTNNMNSRRTIVFDSADADISMTEAIPMNKILSDINTNDNIKRRISIVFDNENADMSITQAIDRDVLPEFKINDEPTEKSQTIFGNTDISFTQAVDRYILSGLNIRNAEPTEKTPTVFDNGNIPAFKLLNAGHLVEAKPVTVFDSDDISMTEPADVKQIIPDLIKENFRNDQYQEKSIIDQEIKEVKTKMHDNDDISITEVALPTLNQKKSLAFKDQIVLIDDVHPNQPNKDNEVLDISMTDIQIHKNTRNVDSSFSKPIPSNLSNIQIEILEKLKNEDNKEKVNIENNVSQIIVYQLASQSGQIQGTEKGDSKGESTDCDDVKLASTTKISDDTNPDNQSFKTITKNNIDLENANDIERKKSITSQTQSATKCDVVSDVFDIKTPSNLSKLSSDIRKDTLTLCTGKADTEVHSISQSSHDSEQNIKTDRGPKLTSRPPSNYVIKSNSNDLKSKTRDSLLKDLLDMSKSSFEALEVEELKVDTEFLKNSIVSIKSHDVDSRKEPASLNDRLFYIRKDDEVMKDKPQKVTPSKSLDNDSESSKKNHFLPLQDYEIKEKKQLTTTPQLSLEYKEENSETDELQKKISLLKTVFDNDKKIPVKSKESRISHHSFDKEDVILNDINLSKCTKNFNLANDTKELLDMLSDLADKGSSHKSTLDPHLEEDIKKAEPLIVKGHLALENKVNTVDADPRRISLIPQRRSVVFSREDLLNNISMAGAALQNTKTGLADESVEVSMNTESPEQNISKTKGVRMSDEIVKTLNFDEDSINQATALDTNMTPLRKTAFGETAYMADSKSKVIPSYLKDVSEDIKVLMQDLVKPMADTLPFETTVSDNKTTKRASNCSINLQANLVTSSQVDVHNELYSNLGSSINVNNDNSVDIILDAVKRSITRSRKSPKKYDTLTSPDYANTMNVENSMPPKILDMSHQNAVLIFDHNNPLNNVLLAQPAVGDVHGYNPTKSLESLALSQRSASVQVSLPPIPSSEVISTQLNVSNYRSALRKSLVKTVNDMSNFLAIDQCIDTVRISLQNRDVNTAITMKGNKELLEANSSLTLVEGSLDRGPFWFTLEDNENLEKQKSPIKLLYQIEGKSEKLVDSDMTSTDSLERHNSKKRPYSPGRRDEHIHCTLATLDLTPKPASKMLKISDSPSPDYSQNRGKILAEKENVQTDECNRHNKSPSKPGTVVMVQRVITEYDIRNQIPQITDRMKESISHNTDLSSSIAPKSNSLSNSAVHSSDIVSSCVSSKNFKEDQSVVSFGGQDSKQAIPAYASDSEINIITQLDKLPFMGSQECKWEPSNIRNDQLSFRMLHSCLRLTVTFQQLNKYDVKYYVCGNTPVLDVQLETIHKERKNSLSILCIHFAAEAIQYEISSGCRQAGDVPTLLRRCASVVRLAIQWVKALRDMHARLAYSLTNDGLLTLKVANIPLRSVWEVRYQLHLVVDRVGVSWPCASFVSVVKVVGDYDITTRELKYILQEIPHDWGHAPRSIWRVFKYLKHKRVKIPEKQTRQGTI